jgi:hypothetical protein
MSSSETPWKWQRPSPGATPPPPPLATAATTSAARTPEPAHFAAYLPYKHIPNTTPPQPQQQQRIFDENYDQPSPSPSSAHRYQHQHHSSPSPQQRGHYYAAASPAFTPVPVHSWQQQQRRQERRDDDHHHDLFQQQQQQQQQLQAGEQEHRAEWQGQGDERSGFVYSPAVSRMVEAAAAARSGGGGGHQSQSHEHPHHPCHPHHSHHLHSEEAVQSPSRLLFRSRAPPVSELAYRAPPALAATTVEDELLHLAEVGGL